MTIKDDIEIGDSKPEVSEPLLVKTLAEQDGSGIGNSTRKSSEGQPWMVYLSTFVAVCGSFEFGACVSSLFLFSLQEKMLFWVFFFFFCKKTNCVFRQAIHLLLNPP